MKADAMTTTLHSAHGDNALLRWLRRRRAARRAVAHAAWDLRERYGAAAFGIAQSSARQPGGAPRRRFWLKVAKSIRRSG
jgi:hypothetical protein